MENFEQRLREYPDFSLAHAFTAHTTIKGKRCYFKLYDQTQKVETIQDQHKRMNQGEELPLATSNLPIDKSMSLTEIINCPEDLPVFETILNKVANKEAIKAVDFEGASKKVAQQLITKVKTHNLEKGITVFMDVECKVIILGRQESGLKQITFKVTKTTRLRELLDFINHKVGMKVRYLKAQDGDQTILTADSLLSLLNLSQLVIEYPPVIQISQLQLCRIELLHSIASEPVVEVQIGPNTPLLEVVEKVQSKIVDQRKPAVICDKQGNLINPKQWVIHIKALGLRECCLQLIYPQFKSYKCQIEVSNLPTGDCQLTYTVSEDATLYDMIEHVRKVATCFEGQFEVFTVQKECIPYSDRNKPLSCLNFDKQTLHFTYITPKSLFRGNTLFAVQNEQLKVVEMPLKEILVSPHNQKYNILSYSQQKHQIWTGKIQSFRQESSPPSNLLSLTVAAHQERLTIECSANSCFLTEDLSWRAGYVLKIGDKLLVSKSNLKEVLNGQILDIKLVKTQLKEQFYSVETVPHHNFICNRFIVHNGNNIKVTAYVFKKGQPVSKHEVNTQKDTSIENVALFKGKKVSLGGGLVLKTHLTFGDYQLNNCSSVFVFQSDADLQVSKQVISAWKEGSYDLSEVSTNLKSKWRRDYLGVADSRIIQLGQEWNLGVGAKASHMLVCPKTNLQNLYYRKTLLGRYKPYEQYYYNHYLSQQPISQSVLNSSSNLTSEQKYHIYLYTTNCIYSQLNAFLRTKDKSSFNAEQLQRWYALTNSIARSLQKLPNYTAGKVYRGISNICIDKAFCIRDNEDKEKYLMMDSFVSTTTNPQVAQAFNGGCGAILSIVSRHGKQVSSLSAYPGEAEVLFPPFSYFMITDYNLSSSIQTMTLEQIPFPRTDNNRLLFWVDDIPANNVPLVKQFESKGIEVVEVISTRIMKVILRDFFGMLQILGKKIVIISDMAREEEGHFNYTAGVDLFNLIYNEYGMSNKAIIYTSDAIRATQSIASKGINPGNWKVFTCSHQVTQEVYHQFGFN